jgi:hypothetical protein
VIESRIAQIEDFDIFEASVNEGVDQGRCSTTDVQDSSVEVESRRLDQAERNIG